VAQAQLDELSIRISD